MTIEECLNNAIRKLLNSSSPKCDAEVLLSFVMNKSKSFLMSYYDKVLSLEEEIRFSNLLQRRLKGEPIAYLTGIQEFWSLPLTVNPSVLIPRPDSEILIEEVLIKSNKCHLNILDLGTGCGALALAIARSRPNWNILGVDIFKKAIRTAIYNSKKLKINNVHFVQSNWFSKIPCYTFDFIISNPPYLSSKEVRLFRKNIKYEPLSSFLSGNQGFKDIYYIICNSRKYLRKQGWLFIEHGWKQKRIVQKLFKENNFSYVYSRKDYAKNDRVTAGKIC
ncbi:peptide chain release factor N(5)-glutamine methyltransferase [Buchnera aphidicola (Hormaphis cornu)]|nr:peptide chain release factor N(5)-glutamine methyltransferase [Buchnera aphidicola (Hormaphis cornu)]